MALKRSEALEKLDFSTNEKPTDKDLKKAYMKAALKTHPDKFPPDKRTEVEKAFKEINEAYNALKDPAYRFENENTPASAESEASTPKSNTEKQQNETHFQQQKYAAEHAEIMNQQGEKLLANILAFEKAIQENIANLNAEFRADNDTQHISFKKLEEPSNTSQDNLRIENKPLSADAGALVPFKDGQVASTPAFAKGSVYQFDYTSANGTQNSIYLDNRGPVQEIRCKDPGAANTKEGVEAKVITAKSAGWNAIAVYDDYKNIDMIKDACAEQGLGLEIMPRPRAQAQITDKDQNTPEIENKQAETQKIENKPEANQHNEAKPFDIRELIGKADGINGGRDALNNPNFAQSELASKLEQGG